MVYEENYSNRRTYCWVMCGKNVKNNPTKIRCCTVRPRTKNSLYSHCRVRLHYEYLFSIAYDSKVSGAPILTAKPHSEKQMGLETDDGFCLQALGSFLHLELHSLALVQSLVAL
jgi:hypothetical protein